jgi:hypothetical protein
VLLGDVCMHCLCIWCGCPSLAGDTPCRLKRETERIKREIEQREMEEALALVKASGKGKGVKIKVRSPLTSALGGLAFRRLLCCGRPAAGGQSMVPTAI